MIHTQRLRRARQAAAVSQRVEEPQVVPIHARLRESAHAGRTTRRSAARNAMLYSSSQLDCEASMRIAVAAARLFAVALWAMPGLMLACSAHCQSPSTEAAARAAGLLARAGTVVTNGVTIYYRD